MRQQWNFQNLRKIPNIITKVSLLHAMNNSACDENIQARFAKGVTWNIVSSLSTQGSVFLTNVFIANIIGKEVFGEFGMIQNTVLIVAGIAQMATGVTATKYVAEFRSSDQARAGRILGLCSSISLLTGFFATLIVVLSASWLASAILKAPHLTRGIMISSGIVFFSASNGYQMGALAGLEGYSRLAQAGILQGICYLSISVLFSWIWILEGALGGLAISFCLRWYIFNWALKKECADQKIIASHSNWRAERSLVIKFAIPASIIGFLSMPAAWFANVLLVRQPDGYAQMGIFSAAYSLRTLIIFLPNLVNNVGMSLLNNQKGLENGRNYRRVFVTNIFFTQSVVLLGSVCVIMLGPWLLTAFGKGFTDGYVVLQILVVSAIIESFTFAVYQLIQSHEKMWSSFFSINAPWVIVFLLSAYFWIPVNLAVGLAWAYLTAWGVAAVTTSLQTWRMGLWQYQRIYKAKK